MPPPKKILKINKNYKIDRRSKIVVNELLSYRWTAISFIIFNSFIISNL